MDIIDFFSDADDSMLLKKIRQRCTERKLRWTNHILVRLFQRNISIDDVSLALCTGEIIERYPTDYPYPSYLMLGLTAKGEQLHVVCGVGADELYLVTAYYPSPDRWESDGKTRKESTL